MARLRIAHFSDLHFTKGLLEAFPENVRGKRLASSISYLFGGRRERFADAPARIAALLADVDEMDVDHSVCTGDLTASSLDSEFEGIARIFGPRLGAPDRFTVVPGNHDRYVGDAVRSGDFERRFGALCPLAQDGSPQVKRLGDSLRIVAVETARPTSFLDSSGLCGERRRDALRDALAADVHTPTIVLLHYGLLRWRGTPDRSRHGLRDHRELIAVLDASPARIAAVLHGHMHGAFTVPLARRTVLCSGSATDLLVDCGYFVYELDLNSLAIRIERRHWNRAIGRFESLACPEFEQAVRERRGARLSHQRPLV